MFPTILNIGETIFGSSGAPADTYLLGLSPEMHLCASKMHLKREIHIKYQIVPRFQIWPQNIPIVLGSKVRLKRS